MKKQTTKTRLIIELSEETLMKLRLQATREGETRKAYIERKLEEITKQIKP